MSDEPLRPERSLPELLGELSQELSTLFRQEVDLAKEELKIEGRKAGRAGAAFGAAAVVALLAGIGLVLTLGFALDEVMPTWLAFLIVTAVLGAAAAVLAQRGRAEAKALDPAPEQTIQTLKEDAQWLSERRS
ncbi:MAG TPA: phage holin family protein [Acidimicrobiales bacterium]|nr:phage holin family protein [Acidimicrobiales bacterium]